MADENQNPFIVAEKGSAPKRNPFIAPISDPDPEASERIVHQAVEDSRKRRPDGSFYSRDLRERMAELREDGKMGAGVAQLTSPARRKKAKRAAEIIAEAAADNADKIKRVFMDGIDPNQPMSIRLQAAKEVLKVETDEEQLNLQRDRQDFEQMSHIELREHIASALASLAQAGQIADEVVLGTATEETEAQVVDGD